MSTLRRTVRRTTGAVPVALVLGLLAGCSSSVDSPAGATGPVASPSTSPADDQAPDHAEPTDVATDEPVEVEAGSNVDVVVSYAGVEPGGTALEVAGFVPGLNENGGRCVLVLSRSGQGEVSVGGEAFADAQSTSCVPLSVPIGQLSAGTWTVRLDYRSDATSGSSNEMEVVVP
ncbi:hypothetical protein [Geodermatophilus sp. SYSU D00698]